MLVQKGAEAELQWISFQVFSARPIEPAAQALTYWPVAAVHLFYYCTATHKRIWSGERSPGSSPRATRWSFPTFVDTAIAASRPAETITSTIRSEPWLWIRSKSWKNLVSNSSLWSVMIEV